MFTKKQKAEGASSAMSLCRLFSTFSFIVLGALSLASCGDDDEGDDPSGTQTETGGSSSAGKAVDLGLPSGTKWADRNVGADSPEGYGDYFAWGETQIKDSYTEENSTTYGLSYSELQSKGVIDSNGNLTAKYDAATVNWGNEWHMPTKAQIQELCSECKWTWTSKSGVNGYVVTGPNGNSIFLPAVGYRYGTSLYDAGSNGYYWSSTVYEDDSIGAYGLGFNSGVGWDNWYNRRSGFSVRPVAE